MIFTMVILYMHKAYVEEDAYVADVISAYSDGGDTLKELTVTDEEVYNIDTDIDKTFADMCYNVPLVNGVRHGQYGYSYLGINDLKKGDMIQVEYDVKGRVNRFRVLARLTELNGYFDNLMWGGRINNPYSMLTYGNISYMNMKGFIVDYEGGNRTYVTKSVPVLIYDKSSNTFESGSMADICEGTEMLVRAVKFELRFIIVIDD